MLFTFVFLLLFGFFMCMAWWPSYSSARDLRIFRSRLHKAEWTYAAWDREKKWPTNVRIYNSEGALVCYAASLWTDWFDAKTYRKLNRELTAAAREYVSAGHAFYAPEEGMP